MNTLAEQQNALLQALWQPDLDAPYPRRGLLAYRSNGLELARRALAGAYPVVAQLLGEENFTALAHGLWAAHPPRRGDVAQWGAELAQHIDALPDLSAQEPFLADVARVEWLLHVAAFAADTQPDMASLQLLVQRDPADVTLVLSPATACLPSAHPVASIVNAHLLGDPPLEEAGRRLRAGRPETALVWREGFKPRLREAWPGEAGLIAALQEKRSLADSLQAAPELDFNQWLAPAVHNGLVVAAAVL
jgi:hypothetical protein